MFTNIILHKTKLVWLIIRKICECLWMPYFFYKGCPPQTEMARHTHEQHTRAETTGNSDVRHTHEQHTRAETTGNSDVRCMGCSLPLKLSERFLNNTEHPLTALHVTYRGPWVTNTHIKIYTLVTHTNTT